VAFATAGVVAATVAIAPPMSPGDLKVAADTDVALNALITDPSLVPYINTYFNESPRGIHTGAVGVAQQLLLQANSNDLIAQALINTYFLGGATSLAQVFLTAFNPAFADEINTYFDGGLSELARLRLIESTNDPTQRAWINRYFGEFVNDDGSENISQNGAQGVFWKFLADRGLGVDQRQILDTFWNAPTAYNSQAVPVYKPLLDEEGDPVVDANGNPVFEQAKDENGNLIVDADGNPVLVVDYYLGNSNPARRGSFGVLYNSIKGTGLSPDQQVTLDEYWDGGATEVVRNRLINATGDPGQKKLIETYFDGGIDEVIREGLLANGDANSRNLTNEFFDNGITGVVRYLLVGPVPAPAPATTLAAKVDESADDAETTDADAKITDADAKTSAVKVAAAEAAAAPAAAAEPAAEATTKVKEKAAAEEGDAATNVKTGNKFEPVIILPGAATKSKGGGAWGWNGLSDRVNGFVKGVQKATGNGPAAGSGDGGSDSDGGGDGGGE
jgi:hypothetical protein